jgi:hypothetical protein
LARGAAGVHDSTDCAEKIRAEDAGRDGGEEARSLGAVNRSALLKGQMCGRPFFLRAAPKINEHRP